MIKPTMNKSNSQQSGVLSYQGMMILRNSGLGSNRMTPPYTRPGYKYRNGIER